MPVIPRSPPRRRATRIAIVTARDLDFTPPDDAPLLHSLTGAGAETSLVAWNDPDVDWGAWDLAVIRSTWDYHRAHDDFLDWLDHTQGKVRLVNEPATIRWNSHKSYLLDLAHRGVPIVPTHVVSDPADDTLRRIAAERGWSRLVVKPAVGIGANGLFVLDPEGEADVPSGLPGRGAEGPTGDWLVQPYIEEIRTRGEISVAVIDGEVTHAWRKLPGPDDFRVHEQFGGVNELIDPGPWRAAVASVLDVLDPMPAVGRVDLMDTGKGPLLSELELIEPQLLLGESPTALARLTAALLGLAA
ncbi:MAG: hypothetical protein DYH08_08715 [Actinobacteria bacterium ATB1]|nr:hypothetical protein [Actinobacteria bacterium ATB1]